MDKLPLKLFDLTANAIKEKMDERVAEGQIINRLEIEEILKELRGTLD